MHLRNFSTVKISMKCILCKKKGLLLHLEFFKIVKMRSLKFFKIVMKRKLIREREIYFSCLNNNN